MNLIINPNGDARCIYGETIPLDNLGDLTIRRASYVEPAADGAWFADLAPVKGPLLGPFRQRSAALAAESEWLERNWL